MEKSSKKKPVRAVPEGFHTVTPFLIVDGAQELIDFLTKAFNAKETYKLKGEDGRITHSTVSIGDSTIMISDTMEGMQAQTAMLYLYMEDVDTVFQRAVQAHGTPVREPQDEFYGDRAGAVKDKWGNLWWIGTHVEDVDDQELNRRAREVEKQQQERPDEIHAH